MKRTVARTKLPTAGRSVAEWIGATPDTAIPDRVKLRVFRRAKGICHITGRKITPPADRWDADHVTALCNGGENREANLAPALKDAIDAHKAKTAGDVAERAVVDARAKKPSGSRSASDQRRLSARRRWQRRRRPQLEPHERRSKDCRRSLFFAERINYEDEGRAAARADLHELSR